MGFRERFVFNDVEREKHWGIGFRDLERGRGREIEIGGQGFRERDRAWGLRV